MQARQQMQAHQTSRGSDNMSMPGIGELANDDRLNSAIELEVARRVQDRVQSASFSRQGLAMMHQQPQPHKQQPQEPPYNGGILASARPYFDPNMDGTRGT